MSNKTVDNCKAINDSNNCLIRMARTSQDWDDIATDQQRFDFYEMVVSNIRNQIEVTERDVQIMERILPMLTLNALSMKLVHQIRECAFMTTRNARINLRIADRRIIAGERSIFKPPQQFPMFEMAHQFPNFPQELERPYVPHELDFQTIFL